MTPAQLTVQLGALFASGHGPREIAGWTWEQVALASAAVRMYHLDLATTVATGKSAVSSAGGGSGAGPTRPRRPQTEEEEVAQEMALLQALSGGLRSAQAPNGPGGLGIKITRGGDPPPV